MRIWSVAVVAAAAIGLSSCMSMDANDDMAMGDDMKAADEMKATDEMMTHEVTITIDNVSESRGVLGLIGPRSRELLQTLTDCDLSNAAFPWLRSHI